MLPNAYFLAKIGVDTAENERKFAENLPKIGNYPAAPAPAGRRDSRGSMKAPRAALPTASQPMIRAPQLKDGSGFFRGLFARIS